MSEVARAFFCMVRQRVIKRLGHDAEFHVRCDLNVSVPNQTAEAKAGEIEELGAELHAMLNEAMQAAFPAANDGCH